MTVRARLVLLGAVLPVVVLLISVVVAGWMFRRSQLRDLDRRLLAQAASESVGLFDGPNNMPHVHLPSSPIADAVAEFAPVMGLYDSTGALAIVARAPTLIPERVPLRGADGEIRLGDDTIAGIERRTLAVVVRSQQGARYTLWLGASVAPLAATMTRFYAATLSVVVLLALVLFAIQVVAARRLASRIETLASFLPRLRDGDTNLPRDPARDELGALSDVLRSVAQRLAEARLEQDRLLASAAHELRTPLTVLRTEVDLALRKDRTADELRDALRAVRDDVERLASLATALLDLQAVRHLGFDRTEGDLVAAVREACAALETVGDTRGVELRITAPPHVAARFDELAVRQALDNLIGNALKHAPAGTAVEVALARTAERWQITVADHGPGISVDDAERIFEPFQRLDTTSHGAGLGLAIARDVAARHGGGCWLDTGYRDGARFVLELAA